MRTDRPARRASRAPQGCSSAAEETRALPPCRQAYETKLRSHLIDFGDPGRILIRTVHLRDAVHAKQIIDIEVDTIGRAVYRVAIADAKTFIQAKFSVFNESLQGLSVILNVEALNIVVGRHLSDADLVGRYVVGRGDDLGRPLQLLDELRVDRIRRHRIEREAISENGDLADVLARIVFVPIVLQPFRCIVADCAWRRQNAAWHRPVTEEPRRIVLDVQRLSGRHTVGEYRRKANQRMKQAIVAIVDDLARRDDDVDFDAGKIVLI